MNQLLQIFILGLGILAVAIIVNFLASALGINTWYTFFISISENGFKETINAKWINLFFLIIVYPLILGAAAYYLFQFLNSIS